MDYSIIANELIKQGFLKNSFGSPEKTISNINIAFVEHPFFHVIMYTKKSKDRKILYAPGDIKLPLKCGINDVLYIIEGLVAGVGENKLVMDVLLRLNSD